MAFFTIVIPLFNKEKFVAKTINSLLAQSYADFEIIVVDDCSTDAGVEIVRHEFPQVKVIQHDKNKGLSAARNTGIENAGAQYIGFLDADDILKPNFLEKISELIKRFPQAGIYATAYEEFYSDTLKLDIDKNIRIKVGDMDLVDDFFLASSRQPLLWYGSVVVKKEVFENVGSFDEAITFNEDVDFNIRANLNYRLAYYNFPCVYYVMSTQNQITKLNFNSHRLIDFNKYEHFTGNNSSLKLFLDANRYAMAMLYKVAGNKLRFSQLLSEIDKKNLTHKQLMLLYAPTFLVRLARKVKFLLLKNGIRLTSY
ncbi:MAG TPA: glycosyltransferase [Flavobacterium sp.]|jgi:glycosyltransferase involved in cell wall biosynthesis